MSSPVVQQARLRTDGASPTARYPYPNGRQERLLRLTSSVPGPHPISRETSDEGIFPSSASSTSGAHSGTASSTDTVHSFPPERHPSPSNTEADDIDSQQFSRPRIDWKLLTKIGTNWETGTATQYSLSPSPSPAPASAHPNALATPTRASRNPAGRVNIDDPRPSDRESAHAGRHLLELSPSFIFVAYPKSPLLHVHSSQSDIAETDPDQGKQNPPLALIPPPPGWSSPSRPDHITCIKVDSNDDPSSAHTSVRRVPVRVVVFYQSGGFVVLSVKAESTSNIVSPARRQARVTWTRLVVYAPTDVSRRARRSVYTRQRGDPTVICEFHSPVLVSCTERFYISVWRIPDLIGSAQTDGSHTQQSPSLLQTLHSPVSFHPATLSLNRLPRTDSAEEDGEEDATDNPKRRSVVAESYRASLAYSVPLYPERWTLAVQDIDISIPGTGNGFTTGDVECGECFHVGRSATTGSKTLRNRWPLLPRSEIVGVKYRAIGIGLGDSCCVLAGSDNQIQVYELPDRSSGAGSPNRHGQPPHTASAVRREIRHVQTLLAHSSAITAIALDQGRCVSAGNDGRILVWQVDRAADVLPAEEGGDVEVEDAESVDQVGGRVNIRAGPAMGKSTEASPSPNWSHVEVRTPRRSNLMDSHSVRDKQDSVIQATSLLGRSAAASSTTTLHQRFLPVPPVTHPLSLASAAKEYLISPRTKKITTSDRAQEEERANRIVEQLAFNEDRIVGLVRSRKGALGGGGEDATSVDSVIRVWTFDQ